MKLSKRMTPTYKPGQNAPTSGQYSFCPKGGKAGTEVTVAKGRTLPPTSKPDQDIVLVDKTTHKSEDYSLARATQATLVNCIPG